MSNMIKAVAQDKPLIVDLLSRSFQHNKSVQYIVGEQQAQEQRIYALMDYSFEVCQRFGAVWLSDDRTACALSLYPHCKHTTFKSVWLDIKLIIEAIGIRRLFKTLKRESRIKSIQPQVAMCYLWFIGVDPDQQHQGTGSKLLTELVEDATRKNLPLYLETSTVSNVAWYEHLGFKAYGQIDLDYTLFFFKREPDK